MRVEMITCAAGPEYVLQPGKTYELPRALAKRFTEGGFARPSTAKPTPIPARPDPEEQQSIELDEDESPLIDDEE